MAVFTPPTALIVPPLELKSRGPQRRLFRYYGPWPRGLSVLLVGGHYTTVQNPSTDQLEATGNIPGTTFFLGGHVYTVTQAVADALAADGYTTTPDPPGTTWATYSSWYWGELAGYEWGVL